MRTNHSPTLSVSAASNRATEALGQALGEVARPGDFVGLIGDLGAGKTSFSRGFARGAGVDESEVSSPTFALVNSYQGGRFPLLHADLYRLEDDEELFAMGFYDLMDGSAVMLVEWVDKVPEVTPADWLEVRIDKRKTSRRFHFTAHGESSRELLSLAKL